MDLLPDMINLDGGGALLEPGIIAGTACFCANQAQPSRSPRDDATAAARSSIFMTGCYCGGHNNVDIKVILTCVAAKRILCAAQ